MVYLFMLTIILIGYDTFQFIPHSITSNNTKGVMYTATLDEVDIKRQNVQVITNSIMVGLLLVLFVVCLCWLFKLELDLVFQLAMSLGIWVAISYLELVDCIELVNNSSTPLIRPIRVGMFVIVLFLLWKTLAMNTLLCHATFTVASMTLSTFSICVVIRCGIFTQKGGL